MIRTTPCVAMTKLLTTYQAFVLLLLIMIKKVILLKCSLPCKSFNRCYISWKKNNILQQFAAVTDNLPELLDVNSDDFKQSCIQANAWCGLNGLMYTDGNQNWSMAPIALLPNSFPKSSYEYAQRVQPIINQLIDSISRNKEFLLSHLSSVATSDKFVERLLEIYKSLPSGVIQESVHLGLLRSDYMINCDNLGFDKPLQVEMNTIASSFGCLSKKVGDFHRFILARNAESTMYEQLLTKTAPSYGSDIKTAVTAIPENTSIRVLALGIAMAHLLYANSKAVVIFVVQPNERNVRIFSLRIFDII